MLGHRSDFLNNLTIFFLTEWPEYHKNRCLSSSTNSVGLHFHEGVEKIKGNDKNTKVENLQNGQEKYGGEPSVFVQSGQKLKKKKKKKKKKKNIYIYIYIYNFFKF